MKDFLKNMIFQPVVHFLLLGALLFVFYDWATGDGESEESNRIVVDRQAVLTFVQYRNRAFNDVAAQGYLNGLSNDEYQRLVDEFVREEVLYKEARKIGLGRDDYVIKRRLIQKMEYLSRGFGDGANKLDETALENFYDGNRERYRSPATTTFTHVFIDSEKPEAERRVNELLVLLRADDVKFAEALGYGDRFLYHSNYVERDMDFIASHFGQDFTQVLEEIDTSAGEWVGPVRSQYGFHLVMVVKKDPGGIPELDAIRSRVTQDALEERVKTQSENFIRELMDSYQVVTLESARTAIAEKADAS